MYAVGIFQKSPFNLGLIGFRGLGVLHVHQRGTKKAQDITKPLHPTNKKLHASVNSKSFNYPVVADPCGVIYFSFHSLTAPDAHES
jgi:hypothetical protein